MAVNNLSKVNSTFELYIYVKFSLDLFVGKIVDNYLCYLCLGFSVLGVRTAMVNIIYMNNRDSDYK